MNEEDCEMPKSAVVSQRLKAVFPYFLLLAAFFALVVYMDRILDFALDSDMSSEMILAKLLSEEKTVLSKNWFYSTELRILNIQLIFAPLFWIFKDWHTIRLVGSVICYIILLSSYYYLCKQLGIRKYFALSSICLLLPFSEDYYRIVLKGLYYIPHIAISFFTLGLIFYYIRCGRKIALILISLLAVLAGMGGLRQLLITYIPLAITAMLLLIIMKMSPSNAGERYYKGFISASFAGAFFSAIGYLINSRIFSKIYAYYDFETIRYQEASLNTFMDVFNGFLRFLGYQTRELFSSATVLNTICLLFLITIVVAVVSGLKNDSASSEYFICSLYFLISIVVFAVLYMVTDMLYMDRYNIPILIFALPLVVLGMEKSGLLSLCKKYTGAILMLGMLVSGGYFYAYNISLYSGYASEYISVKDFLVNEGYSEGYATFWSGNILTELSDGFIDMRVWGESGSQDINQVYEWLQLKSHKETVPEGKVFVLLGTGQYESVAFADSLDESRIIYSSDDYVIYGYEAYEYLLTDIEENAANEGS